MHDFLRNYFVFMITGFNLMSKSFKKLKNEDFVDIVKLLTIQTNKSYS